jgi:hypothetical protein
MMADDAKSQPVAPSLEADGDPHDTKPDGPEPAEGDTTFSADDIDISAEIQRELTKLEESVWHAPQGRKTRMAAVVILVLLGLSMAGLIVVAVMTALRG